jgi:hypothetical protein
VDCPQELGRTGGSSPDPTPIVERKGPGSADAPCTPDKAYCAGCGTGPCLNDKPAPAADDLVEWLRSRPKHNRSSFSERYHEAADRIEELTKQLAEAQAREIADKDPSIGYVEEALRMVREDREALKARVARLTHILRQVEKFKPDCDVLMAEYQDLIAEANDAG